MSKLQRTLAMAFIALTAITVRAANCDAQVPSPSQGIYGIDVGYKDLGYKDLGYKDAGYKDISYKNLGYKDLGYKDYKDIAYITDYATRSVVREPYPSVYVAGEYSKVITSIVIEEATYLGLVTQASIEYGTGLIKSYDYRLVDNSSGANDIVARDIV